MNEKQNVEKYAVQHKRRSIWRNMVTGVAAIVVFCTTYALILPAITMEKEAVYCGFEPHVHAEECYELTCEQEERYIHYHTDDCRNDKDELICRLEEPDFHVHKDVCYRELTCTTEVSEGHTHGGDCYTRELICEATDEEHVHEDGCYGEPALTCALEESDGHAHTDSCWKIHAEPICGEYAPPVHSHTIDECFKLVCDVPAHTHEDACYVKPADPENPDDTQQPADPDDTTPIDWANAEAAKEAGYVPVCDPEEEEHTHTADCDITLEEWEALMSGIDSQNLDPDDNTDGETPDEIDWANAEAAEEAGYIVCCESEEEEHVHTRDCYVTVRDLLLDVFTEEELQEICDTYPEYTLEDIWALLNTPMTLDAAPVNFSDYITNLKVEKIVNGDWTPASEFEDGDRIKVSIDYTIPDNTLVGGVDTICYQLPVPGVHPNAGLGGKVKDKNTKQDIGDYTISETGVITIKFYSSFISDGKSFPAEISFEGEADLNEGDGPRDFTFPGIGTTINVKPGGNNNTNKDSSVAKTHAEYSDGVIWYQVSVTTEKGSPNPLALWDTLQGASFNEKSVEIYKGDQKLERNAYSVAFRTDGGGNKMDITELPELKDSTESYTVRYSVTPNEQLPDGTWLVNNKIMTNSYTESSDNYELSKSRIGKTGSYDQDSGLLKWEVTVNENGGSINGWKLNDTLDEGLEIVGSIQVQHYNGYWQDITGITPTINAAKNGFEYTFQDGASGGYKFIYYSTAPTTDGTAAKNTAVFKDPDNKPYTAEINPTVNLRKEGVSKSAEQSDAVQIDESKRKNVWKTNLTLAEKKFNSYEAFTYTDTILAPSSPAGAKHYGVKSEIEAEILRSIKFDYYVRDRDSSQYGYRSAVGESALTYFALEVTCYPEAGGSAVTDDTTPVTYFKVKVTPKPNVEDTLFGKSIEFKYPTYVTFEGLQTGETVKSENKGTFGALEVNADQSYTKPRRLEKGVVIDPNDSTNGYTSADWTTEYTENKVIKYRLTLRPELSENGPITLVDTLPKGVVFGGLTNWELHRTGNWGNTHEYLYDYNSQSGYSFDFSKPSGGDRPQCSTSEDDKGQTVVTITIPGGYNNPEHFGETRTAPNALVLEYTVAVTDEIWSGDAEYTTTLENTLIGMDAQTSHSTTVERIPDTLSKFVEQVEDGGDPTNRLHYRIIINPLAEDLDPDSDKVKLVDTLSGNNFNAASLLMDSVELYTYDPSAQDKHGSLVDPGMYDVVYNDTNKTQPTFEITFNDSQALVLEYDYLIDQGQKADAPEVSNNAILCGYNASTDRLKLKTNSSSAGAGKAVFYFYKVDAANYTHLLDGAEFRIREYPDGEWKSVDAKDGKLKIEAESGSSNTEGYVQINPDTLYELEETKAPDGYRKGESLLFVWLKEKKVAEIASDSSVGQDKIHAFGKDGGTINIPNESTSIYVKKVWQDSKGNAVNPVSGVKIQLMQHTERKDIKTVRVHTGWKNNDNSYGFNDQYATFTVATGTEFNLGGYTDSKITSLEYWKDSGDKTTLASSQISNSVILSFGVITEDCDVYIVNVGGWIGYFSQVSPATPTTIKDEKPYGNAIELPFNGAWEYRWKDLPVDDGNGTNYYYSVKESDPEHPTDWKVSYSSSNGQIQSGDITIINTVPDVPRTFINLEKHWKEYDSTGALVDLTPDDTFTATFKLYKREAGSEEQGTQVGEDITLTNNKWTWKSNYLPIKEDGKTLEYYFEEVSANDFTHGDPDVSADKTSYSFTNVRASKTPIEVQKSWVNNDSGNVETVSFNLFQRTWDHAPTEGDLSAPDLTHESFGSASAYAVDGQKVFNLTAGNQWKYTFDDLPTTGTEDGSTVYYSYYVVEDPNGAYKILSSGGEVVPASPAPQITVTNTSLTSINVQKQWKNWKGEEMTASYPLQSVKVAVFYTLTGETEEHPYVPADATDWNDTTVDTVTYKTRTVPSDGTSVEITGLPKYMNNSSGTPVLVTYTAREVDVDTNLYSVTQSGTGTSADPIKITNAEKMKIKVQKDWAEGDEPNYWEVDFKLYRQVGTDENTKVQVLVDDSLDPFTVVCSTNLKEITDLDAANADGVLYKYILEEVAVRLQANGFDTLDSYIPTIEEPDEGTDFTGYLLKATNTRKPSYELPHTGGAGTSLYTLAGLAISIGALGGLLMKTKRKKGEAD